MRNGYRAFFRGRQTMVWAYGINEAQQKAATFFRAKLREVVVMLAVKGRVAA